MNDLIKKTNIKMLLGIGAAILLVIALVVYFVLKPKVITCTRQEVLLDGFKTTEDLVVKVKSDKISNIKFTKEINVSDYYDQYGTYYDSLSKVLKASYDYLGTDYSISKKDHNIVTEIDINKSGLILNNLTIKYNGQDDTTLRYDGVTDLNDSSAIKVKDSYTKSSLKKKLKSIGYTCK